MWVAWRRAGEAGTLASGTGWPSGTRTPLEPTVPRLLQESFPVPTFRAINTIDSAGPALFPPPLLFSDCQTRVTRVWFDSSSAESRYSITPGPLVTGPGPALCPVQVGVWSRAGDVLVGQELGYGSTQLSSVYVPILGSNHRRYAPAQVWRAKASVWHGKTEKKFRKANLEAC